MSKNVLLIILLGIFLMVVTGCDNNEQRTDNTSNMNEEQDVSNVDIDNNSNDDTLSMDEVNGEDTSDDYYVGTYYLALTDGSLAKDGSGTIILNADGTCTYYYGWSDFGCISYTVYDHLITLKTTENSSDIQLTLTVDNDTLIDSANEKYIKE